MRLGLTLCFAAFALTFLGCAAPKVHTQRDAAVNVAAYRTFAVLPLTATGPGIDPGEVLRLARSAEQTVREVLVARGLSETLREQADCVVHVRGESLPRIEVTDWGYLNEPIGLRHRGGGYYYSPREIHTTTTMDRRLIVEIYDNPSRRLAWVGWLERSGGGTVQAEQLQESIRRILSCFPPEMK
jgi:hypothetical protein